MRLTKGADRRRISPRENITNSEIEALQESGTLILDDRRRRPLYFDGRFLTASDLTRDQNYFLSRQADLSRAGGVGVVRGLMVSAGRSAGSIEISEGHGITASGELVVVPRHISLELTNIADMQRLNAALGLSRRPNEPARARSGLFIVALRAVEYTANPITSYPTSITGNRTTNDSEIIEGVAVTLIPYVDEGPSGEPSQRRSRVAREIFLMGAERGLPVDALPLAMIALDMGGVQWVDPWMVRRDVGSARSDILGLGFAPRALREAHFLQYDRQLNDVLKQRDDSNRSRRFAASSYFAALPPGGRMPAAAIDPADFSQTYFPAEVDVELSIVPEDEILGLMEESLLLPPIDLTFSGEELESTSVLVMIPVPRARIRTMVNSLTSLTRTLRPAAPNLVAKRKPLESLRTLGRLPRLPAPLPLDPTTVIDSVWREALSSTDTLWYVRRRNLHTRVDVAGLSRPVLTDEVGVERDLIRIVERGGVTDSFEAIRRRSSTLAGAEIVSLLSSPKFEQSPLLLTGAIRELEKPLEAVPGEDVQLDRGQVLEVSERFADPQVGEGILHLEKINPELRENAEVVKTLGDTGLVPELDKLARTLPETELVELTNNLVELSKVGDVTRINEVVNARLTTISGKAVR